MSLWVQQFSGGPTYIEMWNFLLGKFYIFKVGNTPGDASPKLSPKPSDSHPPTGEGRIPTW